MARTHLNFRISDDGRTALQELATHHNLTIADVVRACLLVAIRHNDELTTELHSRASL